MSSAPTSRAGPRRAGRRRRRDGRGGAAARRRPQRAPRGRRRGASPASLQSAADGGCAGLEQRGDLVGLPAKDVVQDHGDALGWRETSQSDDKGEADVVAPFGELGGTVPRRCDTCGGVRRPRPEIDGDGVAAPAAQRVEADIGGDVVQPRAQAASALEPVTSPPRAIIVSWTASSASADEPSIRRQWRANAARCCSSSPASASVGWVAGSVVIMVTIADRPVRRLSDR